MKIWNSIETSKEYKSSKNYESLLPLLGNMYSFRSQYAKSLANEGKIQLAIQQFEISKRNTTTKEIFFQLGNDISKYIKIKLPKHSI